MISNAISICYRRCGGGGEWPLSIRFYRIYIECIQDFGGGKLRERDNFEDPGVDRWII